MRTLEQRVLREVRRMYYMRKVLNPTAYKFYGLVCSTAALLSLVSVAHVIANMPSLFAPAAATGFLVSAFTHTDRLVQALLVGMVVAAGMLLRDLLRRAPHRTRQAFA